MQGRGFGPVHSILSRAGLAEAGCFLAGRREKYAYISAPALLALLESNDSIIVCLEGDKEGPFTHDVQRFFLTPFSNITQPPFLSFFTILTFGAILFGRHI